MSEIFNKYASIAKEKGLISISEDKPNPRYDSKDLNEIEILYGIKPNGKDETDIIDQAHPESVIIAPSYDRLNGLVENVKERHNIMVGIVMKPQQGKLTQHRYAAARSELVDELIRIGFLMDNKNESSLCSLADSCSESLVKEAFWPLVGLIAVGVVALYTTLSQNISMSQGIIQDADKAVTELQEAVDDYPQLGPEIATLIQHIVALKSLAAKSFDINSSLVRANLNSHNEKEVAHAVYTFVGNNSDERMIENLQNYKEGCQLLLEELPQSIINLKQRLKQWEPEHSDFVELGLRMFRAIVPTDMEDAWVALGNLMKSLSDQPAWADHNISLLNTIHDKANQAQDQSFNKNHPVDHPVDHPPVHDLSSKKHNEEQSNTVVSTPVSKPAPKEDDLINSLFM